MPYQSRLDRGVTILIPQASRLDSAEAPALRSALLGQIEQGVQHLVLDLSGVDFLDSSALGALIAAAKRIAPLGRFGVSGVRPAVARLFALTHMDRVFSIHPNTAEAVSRLAA